MTATIRSRSALALASALAVAALATGCAAPVPRDVNGVPATARLPDNAIPPAPLNDAQRQRLGALNQQILQEQAAVMASEQSAAAWSRAAYYPNTSLSLYGGWGSGGWGGSGWGAGVGLGFPAYGYGGYPYGGWW
ncbi:hypothetical protein [Cupriavidus pauculus]|uniref:hypothetical protein n=1 Tax=Cupriavidus pauculus TaxID=82633 RepID=UPI001EE3714B|nr:hypothetical protein [Cupriavidus pauculus]GJG93143.1 hypothetical protein CBA19C6_01660 [Cupriavidus pauculus]